MTHSSIEMLMVGEPGASMILSVVFSNVEKQRVAIHTLSSSQTGSGVGASNLQDPL